MKTREPRQSVLIPAQMRGDTAWSNVCIRNVSAHGMMLQMSRPPVAGTYVELRRADVVVVARVMWAEADRCGLRTQGSVNLPALAGTGETGSSGASPSTEASRQSSLLPVHELAANAALLGRTLQFAGVMLAVGCLVSLMGLATYRALARPMDTIAHVLP